MLSDSIGKRRVVLFGGAMLTLGVALVATAGSVPLMMVGLFLAGMGFGPCESIGSALLTDENPDGAQSEYELWDIHELKDEGYELGSLKALLPNFKRTAWQGLIEARIKELSK